MLHRKRDVCWEESTACREPHPRPLSDAERGAGASAERAAMSRRSDGEGATALQRSRVLTTEDAEDTEDAEAQRTQRMQRMQRTQTRGGSAAAHPSALRRAMAQRQRPCVHGGC